MTSKFNTETMTTMRRLGKNPQKTTNISTSKKYGTRGIGHILYSYSKPRGTESNKCLSNFSE